MNEYKIGKTTVKRFVVGKIGEMKYRDSFDTAEEASAWIEGKKEHDEASVLNGSYYIDDMEESG